MILPPRMVKFSIQNANVKETHFRCSEGGSLRQQGRRESHHQGHGLLPRG